MNWIKKNGFSTLLIALLLAMFIFPDVKSWFLRQVASTGILNPKIEKTESSKQSSIAVSEFSVADLQGKSLSTSELKGKVVFINFWASWCPPCRAEFPSIQKFYDQYKSNENIVFLTINMDDKPELGTAYLQKENLNVPFWIPSVAIPQEVFSGALPTTLLLDKTGKIRMKHTGAADYSTASFYKQIDDLMAE